MHSSTENTNNTSIALSSNGGDEFENTCFESLIQSGEYEYYLERGQIVTGKIAGYEKDGVLVDIGAKAEAFLPMKEISDSHFEDPAEILPIGSEYEFYILRDEAVNLPDTRIIVSYRRVTAARVWSNLESCKLNDDVCEARILDVVKGGVVVEIEGLKGFIPASHLRVKGGSNNPQLLGEIIPCTVLEIDKQQNKLILSQKLAIAKLYAGEREKLMQDLLVAIKDYEDGIEAGEQKEKIVVEGEIVRVTDFGAFIKIGDTEMDGLLPISEITWRRIKHPSEILKVGDKLTVQVLNVVLEQSRISLSLKRLQEDPWLKIKDSVSQGHVVTARITRLVSFGLFLTFKLFDTGIEELGFESFIPLDEIKGSSEKNSPAEILADFQVDQEIKVAVKKIKEPERRFVMSSRCLNENNEYIENFFQKEEEEYKAKMNSRKEAQENNTQEEN